MKRYRLTNDSARKRFIAGTAMDATGLRHLLAQHMWRNIGIPESDFDFEVDMVRKRILFRWNKGKIFPQKTSFIIDIHQVA